MSKRYLRLFSGRVLGPVGSGGKQALSRLQHTFEEERVLDRPFDGEVDFAAAQCGQTFLEREVVIGVIARGKVDELHQKVDVACRRIKPLRGSGTKEIQTFDVVLGTE